MQEHRRGCPVMSNYVHQLNHFMHVSALILNHPQCWLIFGSRLWRQVCSPALKMPSAKMSRSCVLLWGGRSSRGEWEVGLGVDHWEHPSIICLNRPGGFGSQKNTPYQHVPLIFFYYYHFSFFLSITHFCLSFYFFYFRKILCEYWYHAWLIQSVEDLSLL